MVEPTKIWLIQPNIFLSVLFFPFAHLQALIVLSPYTMNILKLPVPIFQWSPPGVDYSKSMYFDHFKVACGLWPRFRGHPQTLIILNLYTITNLKLPVANIHWSPLGLDYSILNVP